MAVLTTVPPGQSPPLFSISPVDQSGTIAIVTAQCLVVSVIAALIRVYVLLEIGGARLRWDDVAIGMAVLFAIVQTSLVQKEARLGLGRTIQHISDSAIHSIQIHLFADQKFFILAAWTSKLSVVLLLIRLSPRRSVQLLGYISLALLAATGLAALLITSFVCNVSRPWDYFTALGVTCTAPYTRWVTVAALSIVTEIMIALLATYMVWSLNMRVRKKTVVLSAFFQRLLVVAPIFSRLHFLHRMYFSSNDPTLHAAYATICKEAEIAWGVASACIMCLKPFFTATATYFGGPAEGSKSFSGRYANSRDTSERLPKRIAEGIGLKRLTYSQNMHSTTARGDSSTNQSWRFDSRATTSVSAGGNAEVQDLESVRSGDSQNMIIRKDTGYQVQHFDRDDGSTRRTPSGNELLNTNDDFHSYQ